MHFSWFVYLFIFVLFSLVLRGKAYFSDDDSTENKWTTKSLISQELKDESNEYDEIDKTIETTTVTKKTTKHHAHNHDDINYYEDDEDEKDSPTTLITTTLSSSLSSKIKFPTHVRTETTTSKNEIPLTYSTWRFSTTLYHIDKQTFLTATIDPKQIAAYLAKTNRDRLLLKIFAITVIVGISSLAIVLIAIHMVRKARRYHGYLAPANTSSNDQSKRLSNLKV